MCVTFAERTEGSRNLDSRAKDARCIRTLTFILSLTGRGDKTSDLTFNWFSIGKAFRIQNSASRSIAA